MSSMRAYQTLLDLHIRTMRRAAADPAIRGAPLSIYVLLNHELDTVEYRPVKVSALATELHLKTVTAAQALTRLVSAGYLERGGKIDRVRSYRLKWELPKSPAVEKAG